MAQLPNGNLMIMAQSLAALRGVLLPGSPVLDQMCYDRCGCQLLGPDAPKKSPPPRPGREWSDSESDTESEGKGAVGTSTMKKPSLEASGSGAVGSGGSER